MCSYSDDYPDISRVAERRAAKQHQCDGCRRTIEPGETYHFGTWLYDGHWTTEHVCAHCRAAGTWILTFCGYHPWGALDEELSEHWHEEPQLRSVGLGRLILARRKRWMRLGERIPVATIERWVAEAAAAVPTEARAA